MTRLSLPLYKKNISLHWEIIIIVLVFQFKLQEYLPIALVAFTTIPSTVVKSDILSTKDGFVILKLKAKKANILNSTKNKFEPNWSITQVPSARKRVRHFWINFWLPGVVTWRYFSNLPKKQIQINSGIPRARLSSHWILYFSTWQRRYILFRGVSIASRWFAYFTSQGAGHQLWAASVSARVAWEGWKRLLSRLRSSV